MPNATRRASFGFTPDGDIGLMYPCKATAQTFYTNAMVGWDSTGYIDKFDNSKAMVFAGLVKDHNRTVDAGGPAGDVRLDVTTCRWLTGTFNAALTEADKGKPVYALDDQTLTLTPGTFSNLVGRLIQIIDPKNTGTALVGTVECAYAARPA